METTMHLVKSSIDSLLSRKNFVIVAIDGNCTAGKTTLAAGLSQIYDCNVFHMDDFFLRPEQRTSNRFAQTGGNVDYERFASEVLSPLMAGEPFSYRPFDCKTFTLSEPIHVTPKKLVIIEGTYSHHPYFKDPYDLKIFLSVTPDVQRQRILKRPAALHDRFFQFWIPMEQQYFDGFEIPQKSHLLL